MTATPIQSDLALFSALRTRRRKPDILQGVDAMANRWRTRIKHARVAMPYLRREAKAVDRLDRAYAELGEKALDEKITALREAFARRKFKQEQIRHGLAAVREVAFRQSGEKPFRVQIMGALGLYHGQIVEMVTGEGKTLTATLAAAMLAWLRRPVHVITVNDYLAQRDADSRNVIFKRLGLNAAAVVNEANPMDRLHIYRQPIVYTTQKEIVADWLRDQLRLGRIADPVSTRWLDYGKQQMGTPILVPGLDVAIVDEADAVLIDEAVTPLIIAQPREEDPQTPLYRKARDLARQLEDRKHYKVELDKRRVKLSERGREQVADLLDEENPEEQHAIWRAVRRREELVEQALTAACCYHFGDQYHIVEEKIVIVDEYTGRFMPDRQWQHGLHQAVEAKHDLPVTADRDTLASLSFQRYFKLYRHLCGMTGTAADAKAELETTYGCPVRIIPTNKPCIRQRYGNMLFLRAQDRWEAVVNEVVQMHEQGRPMLVGTRSIESSEYLSRMFSDHKLEHEVLNAVHHKEEAAIISKAGLKGKITIATNMAGRGTDIKLSPEVVHLGGLHIVLTELHTASRIDRQFFGRAGRQGDPGSCRQFASLEDELVLKFAPRMNAALRRRFARRRGPLPRWVIRVFKYAQFRAQSRAFRSRANVLRHEEDLDKALPC